MRMTWNNYRYILPLDDTDVKLPDSKELKSFRSFLKNPEDALIIDYIYAYEIAHVFVLSNLYICIATFAGKMKLKDKEKISGLEAYIRLFSEAPPHLSTMLFRVYLEEMSLSLPKIKIKKLKKLIELSGVCKDIFVIYTKSSKDLYAEIVRSLLKADSSYSKNGESIEDYKKRISCKPEPDSHLIKVVASVRDNFDTNNLTYEAAVNILNDLFKEIVPAMDKEALSAFNNLISILIQETHRLAADKINHEINTEKFRKTVYSLPQNSIMYEDNGPAVVDKLVSLNSYVDFDVKNEHEALLKLSQNFDNSDEWFEQLTDIRRELLIKTAQSMDTYLKKEHTGLIIATLDKFVTAFKSEVKKPDLVSEIITEYLDKIDEKTLHKYINPLNPKYPFVHKGVGVINFNICQIGDIIEAAVSAERLILIGDFENELFSLFFKAATGQQLKDERLRVVQYAD